MTDKKKPAKKTPVETIVEMSAVNQAKKKAAPRKRTPKTVAPPVYTNFLERLLSSPESQVVLTKEEQAYLVTRVVEQSLILSEARKYAMGRSHVEIPTMSIGSRVMKAASGGFPATQTSRDFSSINLISSRVVLPWTITNEFLNDNSPAQASALIVDMMAIQAANDIEDLAINGDEDSSDGLLRGNDGWVKQATQLRRITLRRREIEKRDVVAALIQIPAKYRGKIRRLRAWVGPNAFLDILGEVPRDADKVKIGDLSVRMEAYLPDTSVLVTDPNNLVWGVQNEMSCRVTTEGRNAIDFDESYFALHIRCDFVLQNPDAAVHLYLEPWWEALDNAAGSVKRRIKLWVSTKANRMGRRIQWVLGWGRA